MGCDLERVPIGDLSINPTIPKPWKAYSFQIRYKNQPLALSISQQKVIIENLGSAPVSCQLFGEEVLINVGAKQEAALK